MDPITLIVTALALGAAAGLKPTAEQAVKDAYAGIKELVKRKFSRVSVDMLENEPASKERQNIVKEDLQKAEADQDAELIEKARQLVELVQAKSPETAASIGVNIGGEAKVLNSHVAGRDLHHIENRRAGRDYYEARDRATINIGRGASTDDVLAIFDRMEQAVDELDLPPREKRKAQHEIEGARIEAEEGKPDKDAVARHLKSIEQIVHSAGQTINSASVLGKLLADGLAWAGKTMDWLQSK